jgi:methylated-DNA-[protein]-cysteine S-methyltransferase
MTIETPWGPAAYELDSSGALTRFFVGESDGRRDNGESDVARQLSEYFRGTRRTFDLPLAPEGSEFQRRVWAELVRIPFGETISYSELARRIGLPAGSARAVGRANATNPIWLIVPCHRVIGANGSLTGYAGGLDLKKRMLMWEREVAGREFALTPPPANEAAAARG